MITDAQLRRICVPVNDPGGTLMSLPDTYQWAGVLRACRRHMEVASSILGLKYRPGAIFTGPEGNGRHSTAYALASTLCADVDGYRCVISVDGKDLEQYLVDLDDVFRVLDYLDELVLEKESLVVILDQPTPEPLSHYFQRQLFRWQKEQIRGKRKIYLIVIADTADDVDPGILSVYPNYPCPKPDHDALKQWAETIMNKPVPLRIEKMAALDLARSVEGMSWKQLRDVHTYFLYLLMLNYSQQKKIFAKKGLTEEQVYRGGYITLSGEEVKRILNSVSVPKEHEVIPVVQRIDDHGTEPAAAVERQELPESADTESDFAKYMRELAEIPNYG